MKKKTYVRTILGLIGIVIFSIILYIGGTEALSRVAHGNPVYLFFTLLAIGGITLVGSLRWRLLVSSLSQKPPLPVREIYHYNILGRFISLFAPRGVGDFAGRPLALRAGGGSSLGIAVYSTFLDRMFDYILMGLLIIPALLYVTRVVSLEVGAFLSIMVIVVFFFVVAARFGTVIGWINRFVGKIAIMVIRVPILSNQFSNERVKLFRQLEDIDINRRTAGSAYLFTVLQISLIILRSYFIGRALDVDLPYVLLLIASPIAQIGQLLAFTPGALGFRELGWYSVLQASNIPTDDLMTFLVGHRAYIYFCIIILALISQLIMLIKPAPIRSIPQVPDND